MVFHIVFHELSVGDGIGSIIKASRGLVLGSIGIGDLGARILIVGNITKSDFKIETSRFTLRNFTL
jgi:hypothetical protein